MKKLTRTIGTMGLVGFAVIVSSFAVADDSGWYGGINVGQSKAKIDDARIAGSLGAFNANSITDYNSNTSYKLFGGYKFNKHFALEAGYFNLEKFGFTAATLPAGTLSGQTKLDGINLDAVGILPITEKFSAFGRAVLISPRLKIFSPVPEPSPSRQISTPPRMPTTPRQAWGFNTISPNRSACAPRRNATGLTMRSAIREMSTLFQSAWSTGSA